MRRKSVTTVDSDYNIKSPCSLKKTIPNDIHNLKDQIERDNWRTGMRKIMDGYYHGTDMYDISCDSLERSTGQKACTFSTVWEICSKIYEKGYGDIERITEEQTWYSGKAYKTLKEISKIA